MLSYKIGEYYEFALSELEKFEESIKVLFEYEEKYQKISSNTLTHILALASKSSSSGMCHYSVKDSALIDVFNAANIELSSKFGLLQAFGVFSLYKQNIITYKSMNDIIDSDADNLIDQIEALFSSYENYIQSQNDRAKAVIFMQRLFTFRGYFDAVKNFYINAINMFNAHVTEVEEQTNCSIMEIQLLKNTFTFEEFASYLTSIQKIYSELSQVIYTENIPTPLKIIKIESGSLLSKILGDNNVLEAFGLLFTKTINLCFEKFTRGGQQQTNSENKKQILEDLNLRDELIKRGLDVASTDEHIVKAFELVTKETLRLAYASPKFKINGEVLEYSDFNNQEYIEANKMKLLTEHS